MIYTAIYQDSLGNLTHEIYTGHVDRSAAWLAAATIGGSNDKCLIALVPGSHPVYFYSDFVKSNSAASTEDVKSHDLFELNN